MNKRDDWELSQHSLRELLYHLPIDDTTNSQEDRAFYYKFGAAYKADKKMWFIYNLKTDNVIGTVRKAYDRVLIRYRDVSVYSPILSRYRYKSETITIPSTTLGRNANWVRMRLRDRLQECYQKARSEDFLAPQSPPTANLDSGGRYVLTIPLTMNHFTDMLPGTSLGATDSTTNMVRVLFDGVPSASVRARARYIVLALVDAGFDFPNSGALSYFELLAMYDRATGRQVEQQESENSRAAAA